MAKVVVEVEGLDTVKRIFKDVASRRKLEQAVAQAAYIVEASAKALHKPDTGNLRNHIHADVKSDASFITGKVSANTDYAIYVEFGTGSRGQASGHPRARKLGFSYTPKENWVYTKDGGETFKTAYPKPARPYMYPALQQNKARIKQVINDAVLPTGGNHV